MNCRFLRSAHTFKILLLSAFQLFSFSAFSADRHEFQQALMGTRFHIVCYASSAADAQAAATAAFAEAEKINAVASDYIADSELLALTKNLTNTPVKVSPLLFRLLHEAHEMAVLTNGAFDPTLGPLTKLWRESRRRATLPTADILAAARSASGYRHISLDEKNQTITLTKPAMRLDLGGIAKGQAADAMLATFIQHGIPSTCITCGGDVRLGSPPPNKNGWSIAVQTFSNEKNDTTLTLKNCAVSTSGDLAQSITIDGTKYSHIIDPATGLGLTTPRTATVIAPSAMQSDALATACCVLPADQAKKLIHAIPHTTLHLPKN